MGSYKMGSGSFMLRHAAQAHILKYMHRRRFKFWIVWQDLFCLAECITNHDMCDTVKILYRHSCIANLQI